MLFVIDALSLPINGEAAEHPEAADLLAVHPLPFSNGQTISSSTVVEPGTSDRLVILRTSSAWHVL